MQGISSFTLKKIGIIAILLLPFTQGLLYRLSIADEYTPDKQDEDYVEQSIILSFITFFPKLLARLSFPIFTFIFLELINHTNCRAGHAILLFLSAVISEIPYNFFTYEIYLDKKVNNPLFDFFISYTILWLYSIISEKFNKFSILSNFKLCFICLIPSLIATSMTIYLLKINETLYFILIFVFFNFSIFYVSKRFNKGQEIGLDLIIFSIAVFLSNLMKTNYNYVGVVAVSLMYLFSDNYVNSMIVECLVLSITNSFDILTFLCVYLVSKYSGWDTIKNSKWLYVIYPLFLSFLTLMFSLIEVGEVFSISEFMESIDEYKVRF